MTLEITEFRCPTCGQIVGEEEYRNAYNVLDRKVQSLCKEKMQEQETRHSEEIRQLEERHSREFQNKVSQEVKARLKNEKEMNINEEVRAALRDKEATHRLQISRLEEQNRGLAEQVQRQQKTLESIPPEVRGTAAEINLYEDLHTAFPQDDLVQKIVGVEMPDIVETIVTENGQRISAPILWDMKTGEKITPADIEKAKTYKEKYNTDDCILVTTTGISAKDTKNRKAGFIGKRNGILLVHKSVAVAIAEETRNYIIKKTTLVKNSIGRSSKQVELYDYITSPMRLRKIQKKFENRIKLEELIRKQEDYNKRTWEEQKGLIKETFDLATQDESKIESITQGGKDNEEEDLSPS